MYTMPMSCIANQYQIPPTKQATIKEKTKKNKKNTKKTHKKLPATPLATSGS
jgi:hypothetical protein